MYSAFKNIKVEIFGESHAPEIGVRLSGIPKGIKIDEDMISAINVIKVIIFFILFLLQLSL